MKKLSRWLLFAGAMLTILFVISLSASAQRVATDAIASPTCTPSNIILDGGFETGGIPSTIWNDPQTSTTFGTPLCSIASCGTGSGTAPPRTGTVWAWFGGVPQPETAALGQNVTIPVGVPAAFRFWMRVGTVTAPFTDVLNVKIDNVTIQSYSEPSAAEAVYTDRLIDLTSFGDGVSHNIQFEYIGSTSGTASFVIDDVSLDLGPPCPTPAPTLTPPTQSPTPSCTPAEQVADSTFENGNPWTAWTIQTSTNFGTPICDTALCGTDSGAAVPFGGNNWVWFGGIAAAESATFGQTITIPTGAPATLSFQLRIGRVSTPFTDTLTVKIDGTTITTITEPSTAEGSYMLRSFDVSGFADGVSHSILFTYTGTTSGAANFNVDNVSLTGGGVCVTPTPTNSATSTPTVTPTNTPTATPPATISGTVTYGNAIGSPATRFVSNVLISGLGSPDVSATTGFPDGTYWLTGFGSGSYTVMPTKTGGTSGSISSFDAAKIAQHVSGSTVLSGNQLVVADVSGNGMISSFDAALVARFAAALSGAGSTGEWRFVPANRMYASVTGNNAGQDFVALLMGEVSGNWTDSAPRPFGRSY